MPIGIMYVLYVHTELDPKVYELILLVYYVYCMIFV